jgi:hypothetical protein
MLSEIKKFEYYKTFTNKVELATCKVCFNSFVKWKRHVNPTCKRVYVRPSTSVTCSKKCSAEYIKFLRNLRK